MGNWGGEYLSWSACRAALGALLLAVVLCAAASAQDADNGAPLEGDAYTAAESAYKAFEQGNYKSSAGSAAEAGSLGRRLADRLLASGAAELLERLRSL